MIVLASLSLATVAVPVWPPCTTTAVAVQLTPQLYPLGQQPPPPSLPQLNHPPAHPPTPNSGGSLPLGTAMVTPLLVRMVEGVAAGQDVKPQDRPTWQQPG